MPLPDGTLLVVLTLRCIVANTWVQPATWNTYWNNEAFLVVRNVPLKRCVEECQVRDRCKAVNYWRVRRNCELMDDDVTSLLEPGGGHPCLAIAKKDMGQTNECKDCGRVYEEASDRTNYPGKECLPPVVDNGVFLGNMINVEATRKLVCNDWYKPETEGDSVKCQDDGRWGPNVSCVPIDGCSEALHQYNGSCYLVSNEALTFYETQDYCQKHGSKLVHVNDSSENDFIKSMISTKDFLHSIFWLGLTDEAEEGEWKWLDSDDNMTFSDWAHGEPNDYGGREDCSSYWRDRRTLQPIWNDVQYGQSRT